MQIVRILLIGLVTALAVLAASIANGPGLGLQVLPAGSTILAEGFDGSLEGVNLVRSSELEEVTSGIPLPVLVDGSAAALQEELGLAAELIAAIAGLAPTIFIADASAVYSVHPVSSDRLEGAMAEVYPSILVEQSSGVTSFSLTAPATGVGLSVAVSILVEHPESTAFLQLSPPIRKASPEPSPPGEAQPAWPWIVLAIVAIAILIWWLSRR